jgi:predicted dehydrogenase
VILTLQFENGAMGNLYVDAGAQRPDQSQALTLVFQGEEGSLEATFTFIGGKIWGSHYDQPQPKVLPLPDSLFGEVDRSLPYFQQILQRFQRQSIGDRLFIDAILANQNPTPTLYDGLKAALVVDAALEAAQSGLWVSLPHGV